jgi:hypothetical protein
VSTGRFLYDYFIDLNNLTSQRFVMVNSVFSTGFVGSYKVDRDVKSGWTIANGTTGEVVAI